MRVIFFDGYWFTNVGEGFIDFGGLELTKRIFNNPKICCVSEMSDYYLSNIRCKRTSRKESLKKIISKDYSNNSHLNPTHMSDYLCADYVVIPGLVGAIEFLNSPISHMVTEFKKKGMKIVFLGLGCGKYDEIERIEFSKYLEMIKPELVLSRDEYVYNSFKDIAPCINGIDCALWTVDSFDPRGFVDLQYDVVTFNRIKEPDLWNDWDRPIVRPWHNQFFYDGTQSKDKSFISDTIFDYLTVYANANNVYTDLVHATIVSLAYGTPVKYWYTDKRAKVFDSIKDLKIDSNKMMTVSADCLSKQKNELIISAKKQLGFIL